MEVFLKINKSLDTLIVGAGFAGMYSLHKQLSEGYKWTYVGKQDTSDVPSISIKPDNSDEYILFKLTK